MIDGEEKSLDEILGESLSETYDAAESAGDDGATDQTRDDGRDEKGRFASRNTDQAAQSAPVDAAAAATQNSDQGQTAGDGAAAAVTTAQPPSDAPESWSPAEKALWASLPPDARAAIARREADYAKGIEQKALETKRLDDVLAPRRDMLAHVYGSVENGLTELLGLSDFAVAQPAEFAKWFCHQHRLDPAKIFGGTPQGAPQPGNGEGETPADPNAAFEARVQEIERRFEERLTQTLNAPVQAKAQTDLQKFKSEAAKNAPHYANPRVKQAMADILRASQDDNLTFEKAYEEALWWVPEIRSQLIADREKAALDAKAKEAAEAAKRARGAAGPQLRAVGSPGEVTGVPGSIDQTMAEVYDRMNGAA